MNVGASGPIPEEVSGWLADQLFEHVPSNIVVIDRNYRVLLANRQFKEVFGDPQGKHCYEAYKRRDTVCGSCMAARTFDDGRIRVNDEEGIDRKGKPAHYVAYTVPVYGRDGQITHVIEMSHDVTENKALQRAYDVLFERVPCYVAVINRDLRIVRGNEMLRKTFGDRTGAHCYEVYKQRADQCPDCPAVRTFADGKICQSRQQGTDRRGRPTHYIVRSAPLTRSTTDFNHVIEMSTDITEVQELADKLEMESTFKNVLIENTLDALVATDHTGKVTIFNRAAEELFKVAAEEVIGVSRASRFMPRELIQAIREGGSGLALNDAVVEDSSGTETPVRFSGSVLKERDRIIGGAAFFQDLRDWKRLERENLDNERLAAVGQTVAQLAHGTKNILNGLRGGMYIMKAGMKAGSHSRITRGWSMLERNIERITVMVKGFLNFAKGHTPDVRSTDPNAIAREVFELYRDSAAQKGIELLWEPSPGIAPANLDQEDLHTCLSNLVSNAIDACQMSDSEGCTVTLKVEHREGRLVFAVNDTGCGMDYEVKNKVFTTFFTTKGTGGTGLGLLVTRKIVQEHGGTITIESEPGRGSSFRIELPRDRLPQAGVSDPRASPGPRRAAGALVAGHLPETSEEPDEPDAGSSGEGSGSSS